MELPLEFLASFLLGYAVQSSSGFARHTGWFAASVLILNLIRMLHGAAQIRKDKRYNNQVQLHLGIFSKTFLDLFASVVALILPFIAIYNLSGESFTFEIPIISWSLPEHICLAILLFLPYFAYFFWDCILFAATFDHPPFFSLPALWKINHYRKFTIIWFLSDLTALAVFFLSLLFVPTLSTSQVGVFYGILGVIVFVVDYSFNRGFYFPDQYAPPVDQ